MGSHLFVKFDGMDKKNLGGASGSPVVNNEGHLIGIFSNSTSNPRTGEMTFLINTTDYLKKILDGETPLNVDKKSASKWLDSLVQHMPVKEALNYFSKMIDDPRSAAIYFAERNSGILGFHVALAKAHRKNNENGKAIATLKKALTEVHEEDRAKIEKLLKEYTEK